LLENARLFCSFVTLCNQYDILFLLTQVMILKISYIIQKNG